MSSLGVRRASLGGATQPAAKQPFSFGSASGSTFGSGPPAGPSHSNATAGSLFGNTATQQQPQSLGQQGQQTQQPSGGGLFGGQNAQSGGLFGGQNAQNVQQSGTGGGTGASVGVGASSFSFGAQNNQAAGQQNKPAASLFGAQPAAGSSTQPFGSSLFGQSQAQQPKPAFSFSQPQQPQTASQGGAFGSSFQQTSAPASNNNQAASSPFLSHPYYAREKFDHLPEDQRKLIEELDNFMQTQRRNGAPLATMDFAPIAKVSEEAQELTSDLSSLGAALEIDLLAARDANKRVEEDDRDSGNLLELLRGEARTDWLRGFFERSANEFRERILRYRATMEQIERHLSSVDNRESHSPEAISEAIRVQHASFMALASSVAALHSEVEGFKRRYSDWYFQTHRTARDPFTALPDDFARSFG
ncbi:Nuclear pore complex, Nup98 component (sc Nup145/Nup100/Nup116) [Ceraceosorus bombacis]|uniref:Nuclear pore complex, Nup98 component (Sc Nup145/Nup100/Nup116) n=1 Tax=Ceraceosorus bombacis TaxID=401625 RepID=A0A0N7L8Z4_9BASI|nr:Nuclear pore complex, Nup98 component (sc Nup145/Nup100/Nup116) [Ceraceosorus bombacis]